MPDLSNLLDTSQFLLPPCDSDVCFEDREPETVEASNGRCRIWDRRLRCLALEKSGSSAEKSGPGVTYSRRNHKRWARGEVVEAERRNRRPMISKSLEDHVSDWVAKKVASGVPERECQLPFLVNAPKMELELMNLGRVESAITFDLTPSWMIRCSSKYCKCDNHWPSTGGRLSIYSFTNVPQALPSDLRSREYPYSFVLANVECRICNRPIYSGEEVLCSVRGCGDTYHRKCVQNSLGFSASRNFICPQHVCFICKQKGHWRCIRCMVAAHSKCAPWPDSIVYSLSQPRRAVCWRHPTDWRFEKKHEVPTSDIEEVFYRLPVPYIDEEFRMDLMLKDDAQDEMKPTPYVHIRRNLYLVKKKRGDVDADVGCTNCKADSTCSEDCVCRVQSISCSKSCYCSEFCTNRPFRKDKKVKVVKTKHCGWGVEAAESIKKGEFVIEYIGEVIDDALCEQRLWDMKYRGDQNFYMCEIGKDFTIDATFKGNVSRFLNHSCDPNCKLEKWQADGETRVGVFAARSIEAGEPLTYDYRFVLFGPMVKCFCGASQCRGYLGSKKKIDTVELCWGSKRKRSIAIMASSSN